VKARTWDRTAGDVRKREIVADSDALMQIRHAACQKRVRLRFEPEYL
jgi:hypothetical protein